MATAPEAAICSRRSHSGSPETCHPWRKRAIPEEKCNKMLLVASRLSDLAPPFLDGAPLPCARPLRTPVGIYALAPPVLPRDPVPPPNIRSTYASRSMLSSPFDRSWRVKFHLNGAGDAGHPISNLPPHSMCKRNKADSKLIPLARFPHLQALESRDLDQRRMREDDMNSEPLTEKIGIPVRA